MRDAVEALDVADLAIGRARGVVPDTTVDDAEAYLAELRSRRGFTGDTLVLAIAGGTGSGKSSLLNALAGRPIASVSALRPHTDRPLAWVPEDAGPGVGRLLDELGIDDRVTQTEFPGLAIVDLPDMDSIADWHRKSVEELLPQLDAVVWVFDPEKYRDRVMHEEFLKPLSDYRDQFIFVLNKIDLLGPEATSQVTTHLLGVLADDGYPDPPLFAVAANPPDGTSVGVEPFADMLRHRLDAKTLVVGKLLADIRAMLRQVADEAGVWRGASVDFEERWDRVVEATAAALAGGRDRAGIEDALCRVEDFVAAISVETDGSFGARLRERLPVTEIEDAVAAAAKAAADAAGQGRRRDIAAGEAAARAELEARVGAPLRQELWQRARFGATVAYAVVGAAQIEERVKRRAR